VEYDATAQIVLADLRTDGKPRKVLMLAPKDGFYYVIDRLNGRVISAEKLGKVTWADRIDLVSGRPIEAPGIRYKDDPILIWPSAFGMHNWQAMSFDAVTGPTMKLGMSIGAHTLDNDPREPDDRTASLLAWDPVFQRKRWEVNLGDSFWNGGALATAGDLVFQGTGSGRFNAYCATTGEKLWNFYADLGINAAPMTYSVDGVQYISILVGYGVLSMRPRSATTDGAMERSPAGFSRSHSVKTMTLRLGLPPRFTIDAIEGPSFIIDAKLAAKGAKLYGNCGGCHGVDMRNIASFAKDLRQSRLAAT
jgi:quinohemoprotein ethanol dehydrogenase